MNEQKFDTVAAVSLGGTYTVNEQGAVVRNSAHSTNATPDNAVAEAAPGAAALGMASTVDEGTPARAKALSKAAD